MKALCRENAIDLWICDRFKVLPTDDRYRLLSEEQKILLYTHYMEFATGEEARMLKIMQSREELTIDDEEARALMQAGYTKDQILRIRKNLKEAKNNG